MPSPFALAPALDSEALAERFARTGRLRIDHFLTDDTARRLHASLVAEDRWRRIINSDARIFEIASKDLDALPVDQRRALDQAVIAGAARGFQFRYDMIRVSDDADERLASGTPLDDFARLMSAPATLDLIRRITGAHDIAFADAQATRYRPGDFLTRHDDNVAGKHRRLAYVMGLSPEWRAGWGGLLLFTSPDGEVAQAMLPRFNALSLFAVPQDHSVSYVAPFAPVPRLSVTGWLRART